MSPVTVWLSREGKIWRCDTLVLTLLSLKVFRAFFYKCVPASVSTTVRLQTLLASSCFEEQNRTPPKNLEESFLS